MRLDKTTDHMHNQTMKYTQTFIYTYVLKCLLYFYNQNGVFRRGFFFWKGDPSKPFFSPPPPPRTLHAYSYWYGAFSLDYNSCLYIYIYQ